MNTKLYTPACNVTQNQILHQKLLKCGYLLINTENYLIPHCGILVYVSKDSLIQETHKLYCVYIIVLQTL